MENFKITDLLPRKASFELSIPNKTFTLRPCTPSDLIELKSRGIDIEVLMKNPISEDMCKVVLFLMEFKDAKEFKKIELRTINIDTGEEEVSNVGGYKLLIKFIASLKEQLEMFFALLNSMGFSDKVISDIRKTAFDPQAIEEPVKKKVKIKKKKKL